MLEVRKIRRWSASSPDIVPGSPDVFSDYFDWTMTVGMNGAAKVAAAQAAGWNTMQDEDTNPGSMNGYFSIVSSIPGQSGLMLPSRSGKALRINAQAGNQTGFFMEIGDTPLAAGRFPPDLWWQYWEWSNFVTGVEESRYGEGKWFYFLHNADPEHTYPGGTFADAGRPELRNSVFDPDNGDIILAPDATYYSYEMIAGPSSSGVWRAHVAAQANDAPQRMSLNPTDANYRFFGPNVARLVKAHLKINSPARWEQWARPYGTLTWTQVARYVPGVYPSGFTWDTVAADEVGAWAMRMPVTTGPTAGNPYPYYRYLTELEFASAENLLSQYPNY